MRDITHVETQPIGLEPRERNRDQIMRHDRPAPARRLNARPCRKSAHVPPATINSTWEDSASPAQYDSTYGYVIMRAENAIIVGAPNSLNGSMTILGTGTGGYGGLAYVPVN